MSSSQSSSSIPAGATFSTVSLRDSSDWIRYKKEVRIYNDNRTGVDVPSASPCIPYGNNFRLVYLNGRYKRPTACVGSTCTPQFSNVNGVTS